MAKVAINGMGRIGQATFKILLDTPELELTAVNDLIPADNLACLLNYDTVYGRYSKKVTARSDALIVEGPSYRLLQGRCEGGERRSVRRNGTTPGSRLSRTEKSGLKAKR